MNNLFALAICWEDILCFTSARYTPDEHGGWLMDPAPRDPEVKADNFVQNVRNNATANVYL